MSNRVGNIRNSKYFNGIQNAGDYTVDQPHLRSIGTAANPILAVYADTFNGTLGSEPTIAVNQIQMPYVGSKDVSMRRTGTSAVTMDNNAGGAVNFSINGTLGATTINSPTISPSGPSTDLNLTCGGAIRLNSLGIASAGLASNSLGSITANGDLTLSTTGTGEIRTGFRPIIVGSSGGVTAIGMHNTRYSTGTITQAGTTTVVGSGTAWSLSMVGGIITPSNGNPMIIQGFTDSTHLTVTFPQTVTAGSTYDMNYGGTTVGSDGNIFCSAINSVPGELLLNPYAGSGVTITDAAGGKGLKLQNGGIASYVPSYLSNYEEYPFPITWTGPWANQSSTLYFIRIGKFVIMTFPGLVVAATATTPVDLSAGTQIPARFAPNVGSDFRFIMQIRDNNVDAAGNILIQSSGGMRISTTYTTGGAFTNGSTASGWVGSQSFMYRLS